jgi:hypothetical protein
MDDEASKPLIRGEKVWLRGYTEDDLEPYERFVNSKGSRPIKRTSEHNVRSRRSASSKRGSSGITRWRGGNR